MAPKERDLLIEEYKQAVEKLHEAVRKLSGLSGAAFDEAYKQAESARLFCDKKRAELEARGK